MQKIQIPQLLNELALAGSQGVRISSPSIRCEIELCRSWGIEILESQGRGYLLPDPDVLVPIWIQEETSALAWPRLSVDGFFKVGSSNDEALVCARHMAPEGLLVFAEQQTAGRGRQQRPWFSPAGAGLYFSLVLRPRTQLVHWPLLTHVASVALVRALEAAQSVWNTPRPLVPDIKWPNDVLLSGRKTAGILLESITGGCAGPAAVVGVGINLAAESIPPKLHSEVTAVRVEAGAPVPRRWLLVQFLNRFQERYLLFDRQEYGQILQEWKSCSSMWEGAAVNIIEGEKIRSAITCGLSEYGALQIRTAEGREETVLAADVSVRRS